MSIAATRGNGEHTLDLAGVADLYAAHAVRVRRVVSLNVRASDSLVEDACQVAWLRLVRNRERIQRRTAVSWVIRVAVNEAMRHASRAGRDVPLEALEADAERSGPVPATRPELLDELASARIRLAALRALPERQQRLMWLQGLGFSYAEMAGETGDSRRTVERQLFRARHRLARASASP